MANLEIRHLILQNGLKHWQVAKAIGITPCTFSVWMREELSKDRLLRVQNAILKLSGGETNG